MCVTYCAWLHPQLPDLPLLLLFNRDEVLGRPAAPSHVWEDDPGILGGRDLVAGGTWLCLGTASGKAACLTNFRQLRDARPAAPSRGALPVGFVRSQQAPAEFLSGLDAQAYPGFNLLAFDLAQRQLAYLCSRDEPPAPQVLPPGLHGVTNGRIDTRDWPKLQQGWDRLQQLIDSGAFASNSGSGDGGGDGNAEESAAGSGGEGSAEGGLAGSGSGGEGTGSGCGGGAAVPWDELFQLLSDDRRLEEAPHRLPDTGYGPDFEAAVSGIFVQPVETKWGPFGTRSQTVAVVWADGRGELRERYRDQEGGWASVGLTFTVAALQQKGGGGGGGRSEERGGGAAAGGPDAELPPPFLGSSAFGSI